MLSDLQLVAGVAVARCSMSWSCNPEAGGSSPGGVRKGTQHKAIANSFMWSLPALSIPKEGRTQKTTCRLLFYTLTVDVNHYSIPKDQQVHLRVYILQSFNIDHSPTFLLFSSWFFFSMNHQSGNVCVRLYVFLVLIDECFLLLQNNVAAHVFKYCIFFVIWQVNKVFMF